MRFQLGLPGTNRIPQVDDHVVGAFEWSKDLTAPDYRRIAATIDQLGYDGITTSEHLAMPYQEVPRLGPFWMDALSVLAYVAGATTRVRMDTSILVGPYHHPLALAKALATVDVLSGARLDLSVGVGNAEREFQALGVSFADRGAITDETLQAIETLWTDPEPVHHGRFFHVDGLAVEPKPLQRPRPPIYIGGNSKPALRRAARYDGWQPNPVNFDVDDVPRFLEHIREQPAFLGKDDTFEVHWVGTIVGVDQPRFASLSAAERRAHGEQILDRLDSFAALGITSVVAPLAETRTLEEYLEYLAWFAETIITPFRETTGALE